LHVCAAHARARPTGLVSRNSKREDAEQRSLRQLDADGHEVLDHVRADLDQTLADGRELNLRSRSVCGMALRKASISQRGTHLIGSRALHDMRPDASCAL
jgi:hypothetical protein